MKPNVAAVIFSVKGSCLGINNENRNWQENPVEPQKQSLAGSVYVKRLMICSLWGDDDHLVTFIRVLMAESFFFKWLSFFSGYPGKINNKIWAKMVVLQEIL